MRKLYLLLILALLASPVSAELLGGSVPAQPTASIQAIATSTGGWVKTGTNIHPATITDKVGVGTVAPSTLFHVVGGTITVGSEGKLLLPQDAEATAPTFAFGDGDTGIYEQTDDTLRFVIDGIDQLELTGAWLRNIGNNRFAIQHSESASFTNPIYTYIGKTGTGMNSGASGSLSMIAGGVTVLTSSVTGRVGINETAPEAALETRATAGEDWIVLWSSANAAHLGGITGSGHIVFTGDAPTLSSCGTSPSIAGNDNGAHITIGTSESGTCTITFATEWTNKPICTCDDDSAIQNCKTVETTTTLTVSGTWSDNEEIDFQCQGYR